MVMVSDAVGQYCDGMLFFEQTYDIARVDYHGRYPIIKRYCRIALQTVID